MGCACRPAFKDATGGDSLAEVLIASHPGQGRAPDVAWLGGDAETPPLLVVATGGQLNAFRVLEPAGETPRGEDES